MKNSMRLPGWKLWRSPSAWARAAPVVLVATVAFVGGCRGVQIEPGPWNGPAMRLDAASGRHVIVAELPSAGWSIGLDRLDRQSGRHEAFVTIERPDPAYLHAQVITEGRLLVELLEQERLRVLARTVESGVKPSGAYREAIGAAEPTTAGQLGPVIVPLEDTRSPETPAVGPAPR